MKPFHGKKIVAALIAAAICTTMLGGCSGNSGSQSGINESAVSNDDASVSSEANVSDGTNDDIFSAVADYDPESLVYRAQTMDAEEFAAAMQPGWNLGNTLDATAGETSWGNPKATAELIQTIKDEGFNSIRIPITWGHMMSDDYTIDADYLARTKEVIEYALNADLLVLVNIHHDSWQWLNAIQPDENDPNFLKFKAIWEQLAEAYKDYPRAVIFESINEPRFDDESTAFESLDMMNKACVEIVRASGGNNAERLIVLPTKDTNSEQEYLDQLYTTITDINDENLIATVHYYGYWPFSVNIAGETTFGTNSKNDIDGLVSRLKTTFVDNGIPVIIGEWGLLGFDTALDTIEHGEILKFFEYFCGAVNENGLTSMWWDNGQHMNRYSYEWYDPTLHAIIAQSMNGRSSYAARDFINIINGEAADVKLALTLNGNTLDAVRTENGDILSEDSYIVDETSITFTTDYLSALVSEPEEYGLLETLYVEFSDGPDWKMYVYNTSTPEASATEGSGAKLSIPIDFKGTQLSTIEAQYISGGSGYPGSQNWTPYKQYGDQFTVDYSLGSITLTSAFLNECSQNSEIKLIFHFWNGEQIEYLLTITDGDKVGTPVTE